MRRPAVALAALVFLVVATGSKIDRRSTPTVSSGALGLAENPYHSAATVALNEQRHRFEPQGGIALVFSGDSTGVSNVLALFDSIANRQGRWADSAFAGERIRATFAICPESTRATRLGTHLNVAEVQRIASYGQDVYEIAVRNGAANLLGWNRAGMSRDVVLNYFEAAQDTARLLGIPCFRTWRMGSERYQLGGMENLLAARGIYQACKGAIHIQNVQADYDAREGYAEDDPSFDQFAIARFQAGGFNAWLGIHEIGSKLSKYNMGGRPWNTLGTADMDVSSGNAATPDSATALIDMAIHGYANLLFIVDSQVGASTGTAAMKLANFRSIVSHVGHRMTELRRDGMPRLATLTVEQLAARKRGIRRGELLNPDGFAVLDTNTVADYDYGGIRSTLRRTSVGGVPSAVNRAPCGFSMAVQHFGGGATDTFATPGLAVQTGANSRPTVQNLAIDGDSLAAVGMTSYGLADDSANVIMQGFQSANAQDRPLYIQVNTMGCDPALGPVWITGQVAITSDVTFDVTDTLYVSHFFGQYVERVGDHMNEGPSAYHLESDYFSYRNGPDSTTIRSDSLHVAGTQLLHKMRAWPQFSLAAWAMQDTTSTIGGPYRGSALMWAVRSDTASAEFWRKMLAKSTAELIPTLVGPDVGVGAGWFDYKNVLGNPASLTLAAVTGHEDYYSDIQLILDAGQLCSFRIPVDINERTDYVAGWIALEYDVGTDLVTAPVKTWLSLSARQGG